MNLMQRMNEIVRSFNVPDMGMSVNPPSSVGTGVSANMLEMLNAAALHPLSETPQPPSPPLRSGDHLDHKHADPNAKRPEVRSVSELAGAIERMAVSPANPPLCSSSSSAAAAAASPPAAAAAVPPIAAAVPPPAAAVPPSAAAAVPDTRSISAEHRSVELKMAEFLDSAYTAELSVGEMLKAEMHVCPQPNCGGELVTSSTAVLNQLRYVRA